MNFCSWATVGHILSAVINQVCSRTTHFQHVLSNFVSLTRHEGKKTIHTLYTIFDRNMQEHQVVSVFFQFAKGHRKGIWHLLESGILLLTVRPSIRPSVLRQRRKQWLKSVILTTPAPSEKLLLLQRKSCAVPVYTVSKRPT